MWSWPQFVTRPPARPWDKVGFARSHARPGVWACPPCKKMSIARNERCLHPDLDSRDACGTMHETTRMPHVLITRWHNHERSKGHPQNNEMCMEELLVYTLFVEMNRMNNIGSSEVQSNQNILHEFSRPPNDHYHHQNEPMRCHYCYYLTKADHTLSIVVEKSLCTCP